MWLMLGNKNFKGTTKKGDKNRAQKRGGTKTIGRKKDATKNKKILFNFFI